MADDFIGPEHAGIFGRSASSFPDEIPYTGSVLRKARGSCLLVAVPGISVEEMARVGREYFLSGQFRAPDEKERQLSWPWINEVDREDAWFLIKKPKAFPWKTYEMMHDDHLSFENSEAVLPARLMVYAAIAYYRQTGQNLLKDLMVRCSEKGGSGSVSVGELMFARQSAGEETRKISFMIVPDDFRSSDLSLAIGIKPLSFPVILSP